MPGETLLIAAYSARALTQAARRSGYVPLVADVFADDDTRAAAASYRSIEGARTKGIRAKPLLRSLDALSETAAKPPIGLVLGSGFEDKPRLMELLDARYRLIGSSPRLIAEVKNPLRLARRLESLGIPHPETRSEPPDDLEGWLSKLQGGTGGAHIHAASPRDRDHRRRYAQREIPGESYAILALIAKDRLEMQASRQWVSPCPSAPFRYGGAVTVADAPCLKDMKNAATALAGELPLRGLVSFDFRVHDGRASLLEINPRPGATLDIFDTPRGDLLRAHIDAHVAGTTSSPWTDHQYRDISFAAAILYADHRTLTMPPIAWPDWSADRTPAGTLINPYEPIASVQASADTSSEAMKVLHARLATLEDLIYESAKI